MGVFNILTIFIGLATIIANICIAIYNAGENRKIYEIENLSNASDVNKRLENGDYTILYVGADFKLVDKVIYILGRVGSRRMTMNTKQLIVAWLMVIPICFVWVDWAINYFGFIDETSGLHINPDKRTIKVFNGSNRISG